MLIRFLSIHYIMEESVHDFVKTFRKARIETFVATKQGRGPMKNIHWLSPKATRWKDLAW